ncbi:MAG: hypothetical protein NTW61_07590 [Candidatus Melainabacteria bacterium]|nr:hypothetical protein [Candidatus Melainabacteria bacterium]
MSFVLDLPPIERFFLYLEDFKNWTKIENNEETTYYYNNFPEFKIVKSGEKCRRDWNDTEDWIKQPTSPEEKKLIDSYNYTLYDPTTIIEEIEILLGNGYFPLPFPERRFVSFSDPVPMPYFFSRNTPSYKLASFVNNYEYHIKGSGMHRKLSDEEWELDFLINYFTTLEITD